MKNGNLGIDVRRPACIPPDPSITTTSELVAKQYKCKNLWREALANGEKLRKEYLVEQAEKAQHDRNIELESALKQIINSETSKALHKRQGAVMKNSSHGSLRSIMVPVPRSDIAAPTETGKRCKAWTELEEDNIINNLFRMPNRKKLSMSLGSDFAPGGVLYNLVGPDGCSEIADTILAGSFDRSSL